MLRQISLDSADQDQTASNHDLHCILLYFLVYKAEFFSFQNSPKNLDPSYKKGLDLWDCLGRVKHGLQ